MNWRDTQLNPIATIQIFFLQVLHGNTAIEHLSHLTGMSFTAAAYCKARMRVKLEVLHTLLQRCVGQLHQETFDTGRWLGHRVDYRARSGARAPKVLYEAYVGKEIYFEPSAKLVT